MVNHATFKPHEMPLFPYQRDGVAWMVNREQSHFPGGFLCDEMGLGKTIQMIWTMKVNKLPKTLIIVPNSLVSQWEIELKKFGESATVTTYSKFVRENPMMYQQWDRLILDEGHEIRTFNTKRFVNICKIPSRIRWVLSGTPIYNKESEFNTLRSFVLQGPFKVPRGRILLRRTKQDVGLNLPSLNFENVQIDMTPDEWSLYSDSFEEYASQVLTGIQMLGAFVRMRQLSIHPSLCVPDYTGRSAKIDALVQDIRGHPGEKTIVFCQFHKEMDILTEELGPKYRVVRLDGNVPTEDRQELIDFFNLSVRKSGKPFDADCPAPVFLIQVKTGGQGLNLQAATRVYITSPSWNPATELQAIARAHRTGQTREVHVKRYVYTTQSDDVNSIDECLVKIQSRKSKITADILEDQRIVDQIPGSLQNISVQEIRKIFSRHVPNG